MKDGIVFDPSSSNIKKSRDTGDGRETRGGCVTYGSRALVPVNDILSPN